MLALTFLLAGCSQPPRSAALNDPAAEPSDAPSDLTEDTAPDGDRAPAAELRDIDVLVTLDGAPVADALVMQGGATARWFTGPDGRASVTFDPTIEGDLMFIASHPEARVWGEYAPDEDEPAELTLPLERYDPTDNPDYLFQDPGTPDHRDTTAQCSHCHITMSADWEASAHASSVSNVTVQDLYAGVAAAWSGEAACEDAGGRWREGSEPGTGTPAERCYLGEGVLPALNDCGALPCDADGASPEAFGACADCHAPGIDGALGGRDLLDATEFSYDYGVHCDVCHKVDSVDLDAPAGVAGALRILRPIEEPPSAGLGDYYPLTFGPLHDVVNPRMGNVQRDHFKQSEFCGGCHQLDQEALVPGASLDPERWPDGRLPVHSTFAEWEAGPMNPGAPCASCHMPADADVGNAADLGVSDEPSFIGITAGWWREPGTTRRHSWTGPRSPDSAMLALAATVSIDAEQTGDGVTARVTVRNVGPGHAIPTGEPLRALLLTVAAACDGAAIPATGGDVVPDYGGAIAARGSGDDWTIWPEAEPGQLIRVLAYPDFPAEQWRDYIGFGPFGDGSFSPEEKGLQIEQLVGEVTVLEVAPDGTITTDVPLPDGDLALLGAPLTEGGPLAGAPGFGFARVMVGPDGERMAPHFLAVDIASDNRLLPQSEWTSEHTFEPCEGDAEVSATLLHRAYPLALAEERGWPLRDSLMAESAVQAVTP